MAACVFIPSVKVNNQEQPSELFKQLVRYFDGNREQAITVYSFTQIPNSLNNLNIEYNNQGEPTLESLEKALALNELVEETSINVLQRKAGATNIKGEIIKYNNAQETIDKAQSFNKEYSDHAAIVTRVNSDYIITVQPKTVDVARQVSVMNFHSTLNTRLRSIMNRLGFDVIQTENMTHAGLFDPTDTTKTVDGLRAVIKIANNQLGENALPEEFSHFVISGLKNNQLVQRLLNLLTDELVEQILGDDYQQYKDLYNNNKESLKLEAAGKLLAAQIKNKQSLLQTQPTSLINRIFGFFKRLISKFTEQELNDTINEINSTTAELASFVQSDKLFDEFDDSGFANERQFFNLDTEIDKLKELAEQAEALASKAVLLRQVRSKKSKYNKSDVEYIEKLRDTIDKKKYVSSCLHFLQHTLGELEKLNGQFQSIKRRVEGEPNAQQIAYISDVLKRVKSFADGYTPIIQDMMNIKVMQEYDEVDLSETDADQIQTLASQINELINKMQYKYKDNRLKVLLKFLQTYWGENEKIITTGMDKGKRITLESILDMADKDINFLDRYISSMADASDPLLTLIDLAVKDAHNKRDTQLEQISQEIRQLNDDLIKAGHDSSFMIEKDSKGNKTGYWISDLDFLKYKADRTAYYQSLKAQNYDNAKIRSMMEKWEADHTEKIVINPQADEAYWRIEVRPKRSMYYTNRLEKLTAAQRKYYDRMLELKQRLTSALPARYSSTYRAVQIREDYLETLGNSSIKQSAKSIYEDLKSRFIRREDDTDFGEMLTDTDGVHPITTDMSGKPFQKIPVYYTAMLKDPNRLTTDVSASMLAYSAMAVNYDAMNDIIDTLELARDFIKDREIQQYSGDSKIQETFRAMGKKFRKLYKKYGEGSNIVERLDEYYASVVYGETKADEGTWNIFGKHIDKAKTLDTLKDYTTIVGLGINPFSAIANVSAGVMQQWIDAIGKERFGFKDLNKAHARYWGLMPQFLAELNSTNQTNLLGLILQKFDVEEDFYDTMKRSTMYSGALKRAFKKGSLLFMQGMGEHYLHARVALAILSNKKVKLNGKTIDLFNAFEVKKKDSGASYLAVKEGVTDLNGNPITDEYLGQVKLEISDANQDMNGSFSERDKGAIHRYALGRLGMQFRQWMVRHYYRRYSAAKYDATMQEWREGYYRTLWRFTLNLMKDVRHFKFQIATHWNELSAHEKANVKKALFELSTYLGFVMANTMMGPIKDKDNEWGERMLAYQLKRMKMETGASIPWPPTLFNNALTIIQSPAAAINSCNNILGLLEFWNMWHEIESGRYKGWTKWEKNLVKATPIVGNVLKTVDLKDEEYMFTIFDN